jgi:hypothetical protein
MYFDAGTPLSSLDGIETAERSPAGDSMAESLADLLTEHGRTDDVVVASFQDQVLYEFKLIAPDVHTATALVETAVMRGRPWPPCPGSPPRCTPHRCPRPVPASPGL